MLTQSRVRKSLLIALLVVTCLAGLVVPAFAQPAEPPVLVPIGASYEADTLGLFAGQAAAYQATKSNDNGEVDLRLLPITYASNPYAISAKERAENLELLQRRAGQLDAACEEVAPVPCNVVIVDMQVQSDASDPILVAELAGTGEVDGVYIPGGDQTFAMIVIANSPAEAALQGLVQAGAPVGGNSAGAAVQSYHMIAGYTGNNSAWDGLKNGAVDLWYGTSSVPYERGLSFGTRTAVLEQHVLQRGRLARLLQAVQKLPTNSHVGVGLDNATAAVIDDGTSLHSVTGLTAAAVVDEETYGSAAGASYQSYQGSAAILSMRNTAMHLLPPDDYSYDLSSRTPALGAASYAAPDLSGRNLGFVKGSPTSGTLILAGDLTSDTGGAVVQHFADLARLQSGQTLVVGLGDPNGSGQSLASNWKEPLRRAGIARVEATSLAPGISQKALQAVKRQVQSAGALMVVSDQQQYVADLLDELEYVGLVQRWENGMPVLMDNGAAAAAGESMSTNPTPTSAELEDQGSESFLVSGPYAVTAASGLGMIPGAAFEPRALYDYRYGRLVSLIHHDEDLVTFGLDRGTALEITPSSAKALGTNGVLVIDGRYGTTAVGTNDAIAATWLIVDTFAPGETLAP